MQNTQICTRLDGIRNHQSAAHSGGSGASRVGVRAAELVPVARADGDNVGTPVRGMGKPAHLGRGEDDATGHVVGDQAQKPGQFLAVQADAHRCFQVSSAGMLSSVRTLVL
jgi:hypothetical protein